MMIKKIKIIYSMLRWFLIVDLLALLLLPTIAMLQLINGKDFPPMEILFAPVYIGLPLLVIVFILAMPFETIVHKHSNFTPDPTRLTGLVHALLGIFLISLFRGSNHTDRY